MISFDALMAGLLGLDIILGVIVLALALSLWREYRGSTYGKAFLIFSVGWVFVLAHSFRELQHDLGMLDQFPVMFTTSFITLGVIIISAAYYIIYRDTR